MTISQIVGAIILSLPFVGLFVLISKEIGVSAALTTFGISILASGTVVVGAVLLVGSS